MLLARGASSYMSKLVSSTMARPHRPARGRALWAAAAEARSAGLPVAVDRDLPRFGQHGHAGREARVRGGRRDGDDGRRADRSRRDDDGRVPSLVTVPPPGPIRVPSPTVVVGEDDQRGSLRAEAPRRPWAGSGQA